jgi:basic membrane protein A
LVTDSGGIGDKSFNDLSWAGVEKGIADFGVDGKYIESKTDADYEPNLKACKDEGAKLIVCVGFMMADACKAAATANPDIYYAGIDMNGFDLPNFRGVTAKMEQSCFQAGYLAAGMTKTGAVATYTGVMGPAVQNFMEGFYWGAMEYNKVHGTSIKVLGYDPKTPDQATVTGSWIDADKGRQLGETFMDDGADIILPVCGSVGSATAAVMKERGPATSSESIRTGPRLIRITMPKSLEVFSRKSMSTSMIPSKESLRINGKAAISSCSSQMAAQY